jgi:hypothetical protein
LCWAGRDDHSSSSGLDPYGFIGKYQGLDVGSKTSAELAQEIEQILTRSQSTAQAMGAALVHRFANSGSYVDARRNFDALLHVPKDVWQADVALLLEVERATAQNPQITDAWVGAGMLRDRIANFIGSKEPGF